MLRVVYGTLVLLFGPLFSLSLSPEVLGVGVVWKGLFKKDLRDPQLSPTAAQLCPLSTPPTPNYTQLPLTAANPVPKALTWQQKRVTVPEATVQLEWKEPFSFSG